MTTVGKSADWRNVPLKRLSHVRYGLGQPPPLAEAGIPIIRATNISRGAILSKELIYSQLEDLPLDRAPLLEDGEILVVRSGAYTGDSARITGRWTGSAPGYDLRITPNRADSRFLAYSFLSKAFSDQIELTKSRAAQPHLNAEELGTVIICTPQLGSQRLIADFLDTETARIDALVAKQTRLIALLDQRFSLKIEMLLTGRDKSHAQKTSTDIPSIPEVPSSWQLRRNGTFLREVNKPSLDGQEELLSVSHLTGVTSRSMKEVNMFMAESLEGYKTVSVGDLVINTMWAWMGAAGTSSIEGIVSPAYGVYRFDQSIMLPQFFDGLVRTRAYIDEMTRFSKGVWSSRLRLYPNEFLRLSSPVPPLNEQRQIVNKISAIRQFTSRTCAALRKEVELLQERRQALITAAVTGEMDVPGVSA